jgi:hypothetical protein
MRTYITEAGHLRPWHELNEDEQERILRGIKRLAKGQKLKLVSETPKYELNPANKLHLFHWEAEPYGN